ncbi:MAG: CheR family methyltransferase [Bdellovibrionales bacterium]
MSNNMNLDYLIKHISERISLITGVKLGPKQYTLVKSRLNKRMRELDLLGPSEYLNYLEKNESAEVSALVSLLTTHHSYFFREFPHFEYLAKKGLADLCKEVRAQGRDKIKIWSAACSRGQEPYSLSMFLKYHLQLVDPTMDFEILGSDISDECIEIASNGVYKWKEIKTVPSVYIGKHWARGTGEISAYVKAKASIKHHCKFEVINLLNFEKNLDKNIKFDMIFCRNVFIYFELKQIEEISKNLIKYLQPHGQLYLGLSESLMGVNLPVAHIGHSIYANETYVESKSLSKVPEFADPDLKSSTSMSSIQSTKEDIDKAKPLYTKRKGPIKVLAVDDSPTVLKLIERILHKRPDFELVGTAENGVEAAEKQKKLQPDIMTLDIHMPEKNGLQYLIDNYNESHPSVVIVSSVSREDATIALKCFEAGAADYVEKPTLANLPLIEDELCTKLLSAFEMQNAKKKVTDLDVSFQKTPIISQANKKMRVVLAHIGQRERLFGVLKQFKAPQPPTIVLFEAAGNLISGICNEFSTHTVRAEELDEVFLSEPETNRIYFADAEKFYDKIYLKHKSKQTSILVLGRPSKAMRKKALEWKGAHIVAEDLSAHVENFNVFNLNFANQVVPITSFAYESDKFLSSEEGQRCSVKGK